MKIRTAITLFLLVILAIQAPHNRTARGEDPTHHPKYREFLRLYNDYEKYAATRDFSRALEPITAALALAREIYGENSVTTGVIYDRLGYAEFATGSFDRSLTLFNRAAEIYDGAYGSGNEYTATVYINIGEAYRSKGDIGRALEFHNAALKIYREKLGEDHTWVGTACNYIGGAYKSMGRYDTAIEYYEKALAIYKKNLGPDHEFVATTYTNLGGAHEPAGRYDRAVEYYLKAIPIYRKTLGDEHPFLAVVYNNLGLGYYYLKDGALAAKYYGMALDIYLKTMGESHPHTAYTCINLGLAYRSAKDTARALKYYNRAMDSLKKSGDRDGQIQVLSHTAELRRELNELKEASNIYRTAVSLILKYRLEIGRGKTGFASRYGHIFNSLLDIELSRGDIESAFTADSLRKGLSIAEDMSLKEALERSGVPASRSQTLLSLLAEIETLESQRAVAIDRGEDAETGSLVKKIWELESKKDALDAELTRDYPAYAALRSPVPPTVKELQEALRPGEALVSYNLDEKNCLAFVVTKKGGLEMVRLDSGDKDYYPGIVNDTRNLHTLLKRPLEKTVFSKIRDERGNLVLWDRKHEGWRYIADDTGVYTRGRQSSIQALPLAADQQKASLYWFGTLAGTLTMEETQKLRHSLAVSIYKSVLAPVLDKTDGADNIIIIPDGALYYSPWGILEKNDGRLFSETHGHRLVHSSMVWMNLRKRKSVSKEYPLLAMGNAVYARENTPEAKAMTGRSRSVGTPALALLSQGNLSLEKGIAVPEEIFSNLPGTDEEVRAITRIAYGGKSTGRRHALTGIDANEDIIFSMNDSGLLRQYRIIHFAAHGLFVDNNPSMNAIVLTLPGMAKRYRKEEYGKYTARHGSLTRDGYLRLGEIRALSLDCELVVMSACETSMGDIVQGEGMIGLPQAFLIAGSRSVMASLWPVDDEATFILMEEMYRNILTGGLGPHEALRRARETLRSEYGDPYYWASFVIYGE